MHLTWFSIYQGGNATRHSYNCSKTTPHEYIRWLHRQWYFETDKVFICGKSRQIETWFPIGHVCTLWYTNTVNSPNSGHFGMTAFVLYLECPLLGSFVKFLLKWCWNNFNIKIQWLKWWSIRIQSHNLHIHWHSFQLLQQTFYYSWTSNLCRKSNN